ncbi:MAG: hypothetical protein LBM75_01270 [Myxococcales bacterium]|jgi:hypothetical protein|nr:hypothetical protein [Myxococcales bacterium]
MFRSLSAIPLPLALCCALVACAPSADENTKVLVLTYQPDLKRYDRAPVQLKTIDDIVTLEGSVAKVIGRAEMDLTKPVKSLFLDEGGDVKVDLIDVDGVLVPADFHSLNMVTAYYNLERSVLFFEESGLDRVEFGKRNLYYFPKVLMPSPSDTSPDGYETTEMKDNAFFSSAIDGFAVLPFDEFQALPLAINLGVMGHEFTHAVFDHLVCGLGDCYISDPMMTSNETVNAMSALNEGLADFMGAAITCGENMDACDPAFMEHSMSASLASSRDISKQHCYPPKVQSGDATVTINQQVMQGPTDVFSLKGYAYRLGSVVASALYAAVQRLGVNNPLNWRRVSTGILDALKDEKMGGIRQLYLQELTTGGDFIVPRASHLNLSTALNAIASKIADNQVKDAVCGAFMDHFGYTKNELPSCDGVASFGMCAQKSNGGAL